MSRERFWPTPAQELLLGFCLERDAAAATRHWEAWKAQVPLAFVKATGNGSHSSDAGAGLAVPYSRHRGPAR